MDNKHKFLGVGLCLVLTGFLGGCTTVNTAGNDGQVQSYASPAIEAGWIRNGEPIEYDGFKWYPVNDYEVLQDSEVFQITEYKGVQVFVAKIATKPYDRIYTKFDKNKWAFRDDMEYPYRNNMLNDLTTNYKLVGLKYSELINLLGGPSYRDSFSLTYHVLINYDGIDEDYIKNLDIIFNRDSMITAFKIDEWRKGRR